MLKAAHFGILAIFKLSEYSLEISSNKIATSGFPSNSSTVRKYLIVLSSIASTARPLLNQTLGTVAVQSSRNSTPVDVYTVFKKSSSQDKHQKSRGLLAFPSIWTIDIGVRNSIVEAS